MYFFYINSLAKRLECPLLHFIYSQSWKTMEIYLDIDRVLCNMECSFMVLQFSEFVRRSRFPLLIPAPKYLDVSWKHPTKVKCPFALAWFSM